MNDRGASVSYDRELDLFFFTVKAEGLSRPIMFRMDGKGAIDLVRALNDCVSRHKGIGAAPRKLKLVSVKASIPGDPDDVA